MKTSKKQADFDARGALEEMLAVSQRINLSLLGSISDEAWRQSPPSGKGRSIAQLFAHIHNVRLLWLVAQKREDVPAKLDAETSTRATAHKALEQSATALREVIRDSARAPEGRIRDFKPNVAHFAAYLVSHEAHHRGQITQLARVLGHALPQKDMFGMWKWSTHWRDAGFGE